MSDVRQLLLSTTKQLMNPVNIFYTPSSHNFYMVAVRLQGSGAAA
jgi:hypothetical protein